MRKKVVTVVVTYNQCELFLEVIQVLRSSNEDCDIFVIDNASTDGTKEKVEFYIDQKIYSILIPVKIG